MTSIDHAGEQAVQEQAGVTAMVRRIGRNQELYPTGRTGVPHDAADGAGRLGRPATTRLRPFGLAARGSAGAA